MLSRLRVKGQAKKSGAPELRAGSQLVCAATRPFRTPLPISVSVPSPRPAGRATPATTDPAAHSGDGATSPARHPPPRLQKQAGHETADGAEQADPEQDQQAGDETPLFGLGHQIAVPHGRQSHQGPPEGIVGGLIWLPGWPDSIRYMTPEPTPAAGRTGTECRRGWSRCARDETWPADPADPAAAGRPATAE